MSVPRTMQAAVLAAPNDVRLVEKDVPSPAEQEVLIRVAACGVCGTDLKVIDRGLPGQPPCGNFTFGHEYVGTVVALGAGVDEFQLGDRVAVEVHKGCGQCRNCIEGMYTCCLNYGRMETGHRANGLTCDGGFAEYAVNHIDTLYKLPQQISFDQAVLVTTGGNPLYAIDRCGGLKEGDSAVILGPGPIGLMAVQLCKALGAGKVVLGGTRQNRLDLGAQLGADVVVNIKEQDIVQVVRSVTADRGADFVLECSGSPAALQASLQLVRKGGDIAIVSFYPGPVQLDVSAAVINNVRLITARGEGNKSCRQVLSLMASGRVVADPLITHTFPLGRIDEALKTLKQRIDNPMKVIVHCQEE